jgi:hypothetical protein
MRETDLVRETYERFIAFHSDYYDAEALTLTLWTLHTHAFEAAEATPYIAVMAPTSAGGKSRILDVAQHLVRDRLIVNDPTASTLFRSIDAKRPTLFIDEMDMLEQSKGLRTVLNAGYRIGGVVERTTKDKNGEFVVQNFDVFCPKMFVGIAGKQLPIRGATLTRCIQFPMRTRTKDEPIERFFHHRHGRELRPLRDQLAAWGREHVDTLREAQPDMPDELSDREVEVWEPLFAIADLCGLRSEARDAARTLSHAVAKQPDPGVQVIADMHRVWESTTQKRLHTATLAALRNALEDRQYVDPLSAHELSTWLTRFGIHSLPNPFRQNGELRRGYAHADLRTPSVATCNRRNSRNTNAATTGKPWRNQHIRPQNRKGIFGVLAGW